MYTRASEKPTRRNSFSQRKFSSLVFHKNLKNSGGVGIYIKATAVWPYTAYIHLLFLSSLGNCKFSDSYFAPSLRLYLNLYIHACIEGLVFTSRPTHVFLSTASFFFFYSVEQITGCYIAAFLSIYIVYSRFHVTLLGGIFMIQMNRR